MAYDFTVWFWGDAIAVDGLLDAAELLGDISPAQHVQKFLHGWATRSLTWVDHLAPGDALLRVAADASEPALSTAAQHLASHLLDAPRSDGVHLYRPDDPRYRHTVWVDTIYHVPPFLARLGVLTGEARYHDAADLELRAHLRVLTPQGCVFPAHSWDTGAREIHGQGWGRGVGWALLGVVDMLELLPLSHPGRAPAVDWVLRVSRELLDLQDATGCWRTLLHDREAYLESSTAAMFCAGLTKAMRLGLLDGDSFGACAARAWQYVSTHVAEDGSYFGVSACTWASTGGVEDAAMYRSLPTEVNVWGQGAALRAAAERLRRPE